MKQGIYYFNRTNNGNLERITKDEYEYLLKMINAYMDVANLKPNEDW